MRAVLPVARQIASSAGSSPSDESMAIIRAMPKPLGRNSKPEDLAGIYEFLLSPQSRYIVGQMITADGGVEATWRGDDWPRAWDVSTARFLIKLFGSKKSK